MCNKPKAHIPHSYDDGTSPFESRAGSYLFEFYKVLIEVTISRR